MLHYVKFIQCYSEEYSRIRIKESDTLYFVSDPDSLKASLYLGDKLIGGGSVSEGMITLQEIEDIFLSNDLAHSDLLVYDNIIGKWTNKTYREVIDIFTGTNGIVDGLTGLVPPPSHTDKGKFLQADGTWCDINNDMSVIPLEELNRILV